MHLPTFEEIKEANEAKFAREVNDVLDAAQEIINAAELKLDPIESTGDVLAPKGTATIPIGIYFKLRNVLSQLRGVV